MKPSKRDTLLALTLPVVLGMPLLAYLWGFGVDDSFITARYAWNLSMGQGYSFNVGEPASDGVTPLGYAHLLALLRPATVLAALDRARWVGLFAWIMQMVCVGACLRKLGGSKRRWWALALVATSAPAAAWAGTGMETVVVAAWVACALWFRSSKRPMACLGFLGLAVAWRPELAPFVVVLAWTGAQQHGSLAARFKSVLLVIALPLAVALLRAYFFGRLVPLALLAKPPSLGHGFRYTVAVFLLSGGLAAVSWKKPPEGIRPLQWAILAHGVAMTLAGGDWMPLSRLLVPVLPAVWLCAGQLLARPAWRMSAAALVLATLGQLFVVAQVGPRARLVLPRSARLIAELGTQLQKYRVIAALDIGWLGAATSATVVDLAGVTDARIATLGGGHTSKRIHANVLQSRDVEAVVLLLGKGQSMATPWYQSRFARVVELRLARLAYVRKNFRPVALSKEVVTPYLVLQTGNGTTTD